MYAQSARCWALVEGRGLPCYESTFTTTAAETQAQEGREFDIVVASELLEHVNRPHDFLSTCASLLKVGRRAL